MTRTTGVTGGAGDVTGAEGVRTGVPLAELTTFRVGGPVSRLVTASTEAELIGAVRDADRAGLPVLVIGGGSNLVCADEPFPGVVVRDGRAEMRVRGASGGAGCGTGATSSSMSEAGAGEPGRTSVHLCAGRTLVTASAGMPWDGFVAATVEAGLGGLEALSGIPGTVGAAPVQNVGAYGQDVAGHLVGVRAWDRGTEEVVELSNEDLDFGYRHSRLKESVVVGDEDGRRWGPTGRWVILEATFGLDAGGEDGVALSAPVAYRELAERLGVELGERAEPRAVREAVLALRASKGMVLDEADHDTWSAGSFFTNPVLDAEAAARLPEGAPRFDAGGGRVKTSAAWLIQHAGFPRGWAPDEVRDEDGAPRASLSTRHVLAITNRGNARARDVVLIARRVREGVRRSFGVDLVPEPVAVGLNWV